MGGSCQLPALCFVLFFNNFIYLGCAGSSLPLRLFSSCGEQGYSIYISAAVHMQFFSGFTVLTDGAHQEDAGVVPAEAAACMAILRFLWVLFVAIFENRFDTYSADPLDYWACKLSFGKYSVLVVMDRNFLEKLHFCLPFPLYSRHVGGRRQIKWDLKPDWIPAHYRSVQ